MAIVACGSLFVESLFCKNGNLLFLSFAMRNGVSFIFITVDSPDLQESVESAILRSTAE